MQHSAHISDQEDDSLEGRIRYFTSMAKAHEQVKASLEMLHQKPWSDSLGEKDEVQEAAQITANSLHLALRKFDEAEFYEAQELGLVDRQDVRKFIEMKRQQEMRDIRNEQNAFFQQDDTGHRQD